MIKSNYNAIMQANNDKGGQELDAPGAGIPFLERRLIYWLLRLLSAIKNKDTLVDMFLTESDRIILLVDRYEAEDLTEKVLIDRMRGLEDSSRNWSAMMTLDHLNRVNKGLLAIIIKLLNMEKSRGELAQVKVEDVKPSEEAGVDLIEEFAINNTDVLDTLAKITALKPSATHPHPWFGELTAKQWFCLMAVHMKLHRKQIEKILEK